MEEEEQTEQPKKLELKVDQFVIVNKDPNTTRRITRVVYHEAMQKNVYFLTPSDTPQDYWLADEITPIELD